MKLNYVDTINHAIIAFRRIESGAERLRKTQHITQISSTIFNISIRPNKFEYVVFPPYSSNNLFSWAKDAQPQFRENEKNGYNLEWDRRERWNNKAKKLLGVWKTKRNPIACYVFLNKLPSTMDIIYICENQIHLCTVDYIWIGAQDYRPWVWLRQNMDGLWP